MKTRDVLEDFLSGELPLDQLHATLQLAALKSQDDELGPLARHLIAEATSGKWKLSELRREVGRLTAWASLREETRTLRLHTDQDDSTARRLSATDWYDGRDLGVTIGINYGGADARLEFTPPVPSAVA